MQIEIRPMAAEDLEAVAALAQQDHSTFTPEDYLAADTLVAIVDGQLAGFAAARTLVAGEEHEILNVLVDQNRRGQGLGSKLLKTHMAQKRGIWFLEVREGNTPAIRAYKSLGFNDFGRRKGYYQNPYEDAIVMRFCS